MLKLRARRSIRATLHYFAHSHESAWMGWGSEALELRGEVLPNHLHNVMQGIQPDGRGLLLDRWRDYRPLAWDAVITPSKSVSICALCLPPEDHLPIQAAHRAAVSRLTEAMQEHGARIRFHGAGTSRARTGNLVIAAFRHDESRHNDPHLHTHLVIVNLTNHQGQWRSLEPDNIFRASAWLNSLYQIELHRVLRLHGFTSRFADGVAHLPVEKPVCDRLSKARMEILRREQEEPPPHGINPLHWRDYLNDRYRPPKQDGILHTITPKETSTIRQAIRASTAPLPVAQDKQISQEQLVVIIRDYLRRHALFKTERKMRDAILAVWREQPELDYQRIVAATQEASRQVFRTAPVDMEQTTHHLLRYQATTETLERRQVALARFRQAIEEVRRGGEGTPPAQPHIPSPPPYSPAHNASTRPEDYTPSSPDPSEDRSETPGQHP